jgi:hypothetical protein
MAGQEGPLRVEVGDSADQTILVDPDTGTVTEQQPDGGVIVHLDAHRPKSDDDGDEWFENLADQLDHIRLSAITNDLVEAIKADDASRSGWLQDTAESLTQMALKLEKPDTAASSSSSEGPVMSRVRNPILLDACLRGWANAEAELLPANGPVKVKSDGRETKGEDEQADRLERAVNRYLTTTATEYYPETSHMLLWGTYLRGSGFKKIYRCPRRRRPVSEKVDGKDLIVSDTATDLKSCGRITHEITMRPSIYKIMVMLGAYRKTAAIPPNPEPNVVDSKIAGIQGTQPVPERPEDKPYTLWETQCELDLDEFIPAGSKYKGEGIPLPYLVTMDKDNEQILAIRRDWDEDDKHCIRKRMYVRYPYVPGPGFYGTGMYGILGNATLAMTAAWRLGLDSAMMASHPSGLIAKLGGRQINTDFQTAAGEFKAIETNGMPINQIVMPNPFHDATPGLMTMMDKITEQTKSLAQAAEIPAGEGLQNVPVGTMLAQIEQATKVMAAAHKGMHVAQSEEIQLLVDLFRLNPKDLLESDDGDLGGWDDAKLLEALKNVKLVPVSDPNVPSHIHRISKALAMVEIIKIPEFKARTDLDQAYRIVLEAVRIDPAGLQIPAPPVQGGDPMADAKKADAAAKMKGAEAKITEAGIKAKAQEADLATQHRTAELDVVKEVLIHSNDEKKVQADLAETNANLAMKGREIAHKERTADRDHSLEVAKAGVAAHNSDREHALGVSDHVLAAQTAAHSAAVQTHEVLHPPKPAAPAKPKGKK